MPFTCNKAKVSMQHQTYTEIVWGVPHITQNNMLISNDTCNWCHVFRQSLHTTLHGAEWSATVLTNENANISEREHSHQHLKLTTQHDNKWMFQKHKLKLKLNWKQIWSRSWKSRRALNMELEADLTETGAENWKVHMKKPKLKTYNWNWSWHWHSHWIWSWNWVRAWGVGFRIN
jgi:hypothetical protein